MLISCRFEIDDPFFLVVVLHSSVVQVGLVTLELQVQVLLDPQGFALTHSLIHNVETIRNSKMLQTKTEMW